MHIIPKQSIDVNIFHPIIKDTAKIKSHTFYKEQVKIFTPQGIHRLHTRKNHTSDFPTLLQQKSDDCRYSQQIRQDNLS